MYLFPFAPALKGTGSFSRILQSACRGVEWGACVWGGASAMNSALPVHLLTSSWFPDEFHGHPSWLPIFQQHTLHVVFQWVSGKSSHYPSWFSSKFNNPPPPPHTGSSLVTVIGPASLSPPAGNQLCPQVTTTPSPGRSKPRLWKRPPLLSLFLAGIASPSFRVAFFTVLFYSLIVISSL